jgi:thiosulfate/3-mercaptopyruvate sulfurtransferase
VKRYPVIKNINRQKNMGYKTIITVQELAAEMEKGQLLVVDCRFDLGNTTWGELEYQAGHIPGAIYAHLDRDLCGRIIPGKTGRHPLPAREDIIDTFSRLGIETNMQVVVYDSWPVSGLAVAARLWWMLHWMGQDTVAVLDGGFAAWMQAGGGLVHGSENRPTAHFTAKPSQFRVVDSDEVARLRLDSAYRIIDSRGADRYRGENETIDPVAGHIPGAISVPFTENFSADGFILPAGVLKKRFNDLLGDIPPQNTIFYCGSGVTAAMNLLAFEHSGYGTGTLYEGSWSEWILDSTRPIA